MLSGEAVAILLKAVTLRALAKRGKDPRFICAVPHSSAQRMVHHSVACHGPAWHGAGRASTLLAHQIGMTWLLHRVHPQPPLSFRLSAAGLN